MIDWTVEAIQREHLNSWMGRKLWAIIDMRVRLIFAWYDFWVGLFWDRQKRRLYILPLPCMGIVIQFKESA